ncbi:type VI immunity family protein [Pseudomonas xanthosomatis]|uniref:type VI immunity family protein n=1 Tax=Pseudomonas xanthosomatis TaxID=2842356 RepID=UPI0035117C7F
MSNSSSLDQQASRVLSQLDQSEKAATLGLAMTFFFKEGYSQERKERMIEGFERFTFEYGGRMNQMIHGRSTGYTKQRFDRAVKKLRNTGPNEVFELYLGSGSRLEEVDEISLAALNTYEVHGDRFRSFLRMVLPWAILKEADGPERLQGWLLYLADLVGADHGCAGLSCILPYDFDRYLPLEYELAKQYPGLEVATQPQSLSLYLAEAIKGVNWYTVISHRFVERLGGKTELRRKLEGCAGVECFDYDNGLVIRAGALPELGTPEKPPAAYVAVNRILKPLRITNPQSLHYYSPYNNLFDETSSERWYARFDVDDSTPAIPTKLAASQPCSVTGFWSSPAGPNSRRHFTAGEIMPEFKGSTWGATFWHWAGED